MAKKAATRDVGTIQYRAFRLWGFGGAWACSRSAKNRTLVPRDKPPAVTRFANVTSAAAGRLSCLSRRRPRDCFKLFENCEYGVGKSRCECRVKRDVKLDAQVISVHVALSSPAFGMARELFHVR
jgi:hypothetical protein